MGEDWKLSHFAKYENGRVHAWICGETSHTANNKSNYWFHAKLAETEGEKMDAVKFLKEFNRMCKTYRDNPYNSKDCVGCPYDNGCYCLLQDISDDEVNTEGMVELIEKWSKEHPQKTYKDDFLEKFPNACASLSGGEPLVCRDRIYNTLGKDCIGGNCTTCWNEPMED